MLKGLAIPSHVYQTIQFNLSILQRGQNCLKKGNNNAKKATFEGNTLSSFAKERLLTKGNGRCWAKTRKLESLKVQCKVSQAGTSSKSSTSSKWGETGGSESPPSHTTFSNLLYFCAPLPPDSHPSLCCSCLQVNQENRV